MRALGSKCGLPRGAGPADEGSDVQRLTGSTVLGKNFAGTVRSKDPDNVAIERSVGRGHVMVVPGADHLAFRFGKPICKEPPSDSYADHSDEHLPPPPRVPHVRSSVRIALFRCPRLLFGSS